MGKELFNPHLRKFSIRKLNVGVCSVLLSTLVLLGVTSQVSADETSTSGVQNEISRTDLAEPSATTTAPTTSETIQNAETTVVASATEIPQSAENSKPANSVSESIEKPKNEQPVVSETPQPSVEKPVASTEMKPAESTNSASTEASSEAVSASRAVEQPVATREATQPTRSRRARRDATPTGLRDGDPNNTIEKPTLADSEKKRPGDLVKQINWLDFGDSQAFKGLDTDGSLKVGSVYEKEISPGYVVKLTVTELKPFHSTEVYRDRVAGTEYANTYDPDAKNTWFRYVPADYNRQVKEGDSARPKIIGAPMNQWTSLREQGIDTNGRRTQLQVPKNGASYGVKFKVEATYLNKPVKATVVMADGEEANPGEYAIFTTNGKGWEHLAEWKRVSPQGKVITDTYAPMNPNRLGQYIGDNATIPTIDWTKFTNPDQKTGGLGSQVFGPNTSKDHTVPIVMTREASEVGIYIASSGQQAAMIGFMVVDTGDAPQSYGNAVHTISGYNAATGAQNPQPYLGRKPADIDTTSGNDWTHDDSTDHADEGIDQLLPADLVGKTHELFQADRLRDGDYSLRFHASANGNEKSYVRAWIDFNNNGKFDENEASDFTEVTNEGDYAVTFRNHPPMNDDNVKKLGMRVRIALNQGDIEKPTGTAFSGEVEDLQVNLTYPPKGEKKETKGLRDQQQQTSLRFTPRGYSKEDENARTTIDTNKAPVVLDNKGRELTADAEGWYTTAEGRYKVTPNGDNVEVVFVPNAGYVGTTSGINIRRFDNNGASTEWTAKNNSEPVVNQPLNSMDARYVPTVFDFTEHRSTDAQGLPQVKDILFTDGNPANTPVQPSPSNPATFLDGNGDPISGTSIPATSGGKEVGTFNLDPTTGRVTFTPNKSFVGTVDPIKLKVNDASGSDHFATYQPTVTQVVPTSQNATSEGIQGAEQSGNLIFTPGDNRVPIDESIAPTFDNGQSTKEVPGVGTYKVDSTGRVTFQPVPGYSGRPTAETVKRVDKNGTEVTATYQADVKAATPTGQGAETTGLQGQKQDSHLTFTPGQATINGQNESVPFSPEGPQFVVDGQVQQGNSLPVHDASGKLQGTYTVQPNGDISFQPAPDFYGTPTPATLRVTDKNGSTAEAVYQPTVTKVTPISTNDTSTGLQGQPQSGKPTFTAGDPAVPLDDTKPMTFEDGQSTKTVPGVGEYSINPDGSITFTPDKQYVGTPDPVTVKRVDKNGTEVTATYTPTVTKVTPTSTDATSNGIQGQPQKGTPTFTEGNPLVPIDDTKPMTFEDGQSTKTVPGVGEYSINSDGSITFTPDKKYVGTPDPVTVKRVDKNGTEVTATYTPTVTKVTPTSTDATSNGIQGQPQKGTPTFTAGDPAVPIDETKPVTFEDGQSTKTVPGVGEYSISPDGSITFTPDKKYVGTPDPVTVKRVDKNGTEVTATYTPTVTKVTPTSTDATSNGIQGQPQKGTPTFTEGNPVVPIDDTKPMTFEDGQSTKTVPGVGEYSINPDGSITFTPDKQYVGTPDPVTVKRVDKNGTPVTATYTPTVTKVTPTGSGDKTEGLQGQVQEGKVSFMPGHDSVPFPADSTPLFDNGTTVKEVPNVGKFEVDADGKVTFTPDKQFKGETPELELTRVDANGTPVTVKYQAVVKEVTPTSTDATSNGIQGQPQKGTPTFTEGNPLVPIDDTKPMTFEDGQSTKTVPGVGEYSINTDGSITFTPDKKYVGTPDPVTVKRVDKNGTEVTATYTPTVTKVTPTGTGATSTGPQGVPQTGTPTFQGGDPLVPIDETVEPTFEDGSKEKTIQGQGTYTIAPDGTVTFTPDKQFVGNPAPVTVKRVDKNGTPVTATYSPEFTKVTPTGTGDKTEGLQGQVQEGKVSFMPGHDSVPFPADSTPLFDNGTAVKEVPNVGKFEVDADGKVTFTPDKQFKGETPELELTRMDANGTPVTVKYQAVVKEVVPTSTNATSTGPQGVPQTGTPSFQGGDPLVPIDETVEPTFEDGSKEKTIQGQGTYTIAPDGTVTFTPDKQFVGNPDPVTVKRVDKNGTPVTATYSPEFTKVTPTGTGATSTGPQGLPQTGTPTFQGGDPLVPIDETVEPTFEDGSKEKSIPGQGTYTIAPDGTVTFTPDKQFVGNPDPVTVKRVDKNGTPVTATYSPEFTKVTPTGTGDKTEGLQGQVQEGKVSFMPGHDSVPFPADSTPLFDNGTTVKEVPNVGKFEVDADGKVTFTPDKQFKGETPELELTRMDANGTPVTVKYQAVVKEVVPTSTNATSTGPQGVPQTGTPSFQGGDPLVPIDETVEPTFEDGSKEKSIPGQGTYTIAPDGTVTFTPDKQFVGNPAPVTVKRVDKNGTPVTATYSPEFTKVTPTGTGDKTEGLQGQVQEGKVSFMPGHDSVPFPADSTPLFDNGTAVKEVPNVGKFEVDADGKVTFTPDKQFKGETPELELTRMDANGTPVTVKYQAVVKEVVPTSTNATSTGPQGVPQTGTPSFQGGDPLVPIDETVEPTFEDGSKEKSIPGQGTYTITPDGTVTFTPDKQFVGSPDPVTVKRVDKNGTPVTATYSPEFTKVTPTGTSATSTGPQGLPQTGTPSFQGGDPLVPIDETVEPTFEDGSKEKSIPGQGTYTIAPDGSVTFTPDKQFVGNPDPVTVKRVDKNGTPVTATYSPEFTKVTPTGTGATSTGPQGLPQTGTPSFQGGNPLVPIDETVEPTFEDGSKEKNIPGQGTYTIAPDGSVTFTPDKQFVGTPAPVTVKRVDKNGTPVTATYSPEFTKVTPTGKDASSVNIKGLVQTGTPTFEGGNPLVPIDETVAATFEDGSTEKVIPGEGTYAISPDGTVTFTPEANFVGKGTGVTIVRKDKNGTPVTASYRPTVVDPSTGHDTASTGAKGQTQVATPVFEGHIDSTVPPTFEDGSTTMVVPGEGSYTIDKDGKITFTPEPDFVGTAKGLVVKRLDMYGNVVTARYTPTVFGQTQVSDTTSEGLKGQTQTGKPNFTGDVDLTVPPTFEDGTIEKVVPGEGTYVISPDGTITFTPETDFVGQAKGVKVIRKDRNGNIISGFYIPTVVELPVVENPEQQGITEERTTKTLPNTGSEETSHLTAGLLAALSGMGLISLAQRKKSEEE
ncbi:CshA/CshB family fibrillar adhesin-related protein [Streptococcus oralis]|uniref:YSIRK type signal peptide n=4 Tax=Streptococcus TaxID=1301 RepID=A0A0F2D244_STROR|nr:CshA/CshB family fibrillar adhesin-related protein [Streptococcus oralis]KJQ65117.1 YSIRK type signal peptide [Streptococcus oralis subsp. oralis]